jgi:hypothetical protein
VNSSSNNSRGSSKRSSGEKRTFSLAELETRSEALLKSAFPYGVVIPVDVDLIAEKALSLDICPVPGLETAFGVLGVLWKAGPDCHRIVIDEDLIDWQEATCRFTVAEEIAHYVLHKNQFEQAVSIEQAIRLQRDVEADLHHMERNAKWFASAILMPAAPLKRDAQNVYAQVANAVNFRDFETVKKYLRNELAKAYRVSPQAMGIRLENWPLRVYEVAEKAFAVRSSELWKAE